MLLILRQKYMQQLVPNCARDLIGIYGEKISEKISHIAIASYMLGQSDYTEGYLKCLDYFNTSFEI